MDSAAQTIQGMYTGFFEQSQNELVWPFLMFLAVLVKIRWFSDIGDTLANSRVTSVELVCVYNLSNFLRKHLSVLVIACT